MCSPPGRSAQGWHDGACDDRQRPASTKNRAGKRDLERHQTLSARVVVARFDFRGDNEKVLGRTQGGDCPEDGAANMRTNRTWSSVHSRVEHIFRVIKRQFGDVKVRYRRIAKNAAQDFALIGLTNLYLARRQS